MKGTDLKDLLEANFLISCW